MDYTRLFIPWNWWILWLDAYLPPMDEPDAVSREAHSGKGMTSEPPLSWGFPAPLNDILEFSLRRLWDYAARGLCHQASKASLYSSSALR
jgi:hypothetical protein